MVTCDIETAQCKEKTVKYDVLETSEYRTKKNVLQNYSNHRVKKGNKGNNQGSDQ